MRSEPIYKSYIFLDDGIFPNNAELPLVLLTQVLTGDPDLSPAAIERTFEHNNWGHSWRNGLYNLHHYHSTAHEALGLYSGWVKAQLGGPGGKTVTARAGDVIIIPAGVSHKNIDQSPDFRVVGAYPKGQTPDMRYGKDNERPRADESIQRVPLPDFDPVFGKNGPLMRLWRITKD